MNRSLNDTRGKGKAVTPAQWHRTI